MKYPQVNVFDQLFSVRLTVFLICLALFTVTAVAQKRVSTQQLTKQIDSLVPEASVAPILFSGSTIFCDHLNGLPDTSFGGAFTRMTDDDELIMDFAAPNGNFQYMTYNSPQGPVILSGNQPNPIRSFNIASAGSIVASFSSQIQIMAVIVRAGSNSYVYSYAYPSSPLTYGDTNLNTGDPQPINRVTLCYGTSLAPSAGSASIAGRVVDFGGRGISGASLTVADASTGVSMGTRTNPFGYYTVDGLQAGQVYVVSIAHKRYSFAQESRTISLTEDLTSVDFTANP
ncbi:MAG TPA: carboxypeptidase-like regulatory domain-containing protein [Pyrinomonadaceae bacterium]|nr:carboxypeptidase-like regulatory domain-containing protein [Pyrinomonadaceae bacterium]